MEPEVDLKQLSPSEYDKIMCVLKRDRELRVLEEVRIRQLKRDLAYLRQRAALRPGVNADRCCARCLEQLGRILNRGALCPRCRKKVCKSCRRFSPPASQFYHHNILPSNNVSTLTDQHGSDEWLCVVCHKQLQLKAVSGEWMDEFNTVPVQKKGKTPPGDQLRKALHETQRRSLLCGVDIREKSTSSFNLSSAIPPPKPPRTFSHQAHSVSDTEDPPISSKQDNCVKASDSIEKSSSAAANIMNVPMNEDGIKSANVSSESNVLPRPLPHVSPWNGIEAEPHIPLRSIRAASFGHLMSAECSDPWIYHGRHPSDDAQSIVSLRSRSTSSEVIDETENLSPVPLPRKKVSPLRKQKALPEPPAAVDNQHSSSLDTTDSGIFSPGIKSDDALLDKNLSFSPPKSSKNDTSIKNFSSYENPIIPRSPLTSTKSENDAHCSSEASESSRSPFSHLTKSDGSSSEIEKSPKVVKKVVFKKRKQANKKDFSKKVGNRLLEKKEYSASADNRIPTSQSGLTNSFSSNSSSFKLNTSTHFNKTRLPIACTRLSNKSNHSASNNSDSNRKLQISNKFPKQPVASKSLQTSSFVNNEAIREAVKKKNIPKKAVPPNSCGSSGVTSKQQDSLQEEQKPGTTNLISCKKVNNKYRKNRTEPLSCANTEIKDSLNTTEPNSTKKCQKSTHVCRSRTKDRLAILRSPNFCRSSSVPCWSMISSSDQFHQTLFRSRSLDGWLRYFEDVPFISGKTTTATVPKTTRAVEEFLPDDYKLVFVDTDASSIESFDSDSGSVNSEDSWCAINDRKRKKGCLRVRPIIKIVNGIVYIEDSDWELESEDCLEIDSQKSGDNASVYPKTNIASYTSNTTYRCTSVSDSYASDKSPDAKDLSIKILREIPKKKRPKNCYRKTDYRSYQDRDNLRTRGDVHTPPVFETRIQNRFMSQPPVNASVSSLSHSPAKVIDPTDCLFRLSKALADRPTTAHDFGRDTITFGSLFSLAFRQTLYRPQSVFFNLEDCLLTPQKWDIPRDKHLRRTLCARSIDSKTTGSLFELSNHLSLQFNRGSLIPVCDQTAYLADGIFKPDVDVSSATVPYVVISAFSNIVLWVLKNYNSTQQSGHHHLFLQPLTLDFNSAVERRNCRPESANRVNDGFGRCSCCRLVCCGATPATGPRRSVLRSTERARQQPVQQRVIDLGCCHTSFGDPFLPDHRCLLLLLHEHQVVFTAFQRELPALECSTARVGDAVVVLTASPRSISWPSGERCFSVRGNAYSRPLQPLPRLPVSCPVPEVNNNNPHRRKLAAAAYDARLFSSSGRRGRRFADLTYMSAHSIRRCSEGESSPDSLYLPYCTHSISREVPFQLSTCKLLTVLDVPEFGGVLLRTAFQGSFDPSWIKPVPVSKTAIKCITKKRHLKRNKKFNSDPRTRIDTVLPLCRSSDRCLISKSSVIDSKVVFILNPSLLLFYNISYSVPFPICVDLRAYFLHMIVNSPDALVLSPLFDTAILSYIRQFVVSMIASGCDIEHLFSRMQPQPTICFGSSSVVNSVEDRSDCCCSSPCDVPTSPSIVDATIEEASFEDGEVLSSGDELDKLESDTDSQDTVIEGEAYKRMRSVAIKEKILHANEELFGPTQHQQCIKSAESEVSAVNCIRQNILPKICCKEEIDRFQSNFTSLKDIDTMKFNLPSHINRDQVSVSLTSFFTSDSEIHPLEQNVSNSCKNKIAPDTHLHQKEDIEALANSKYRFIIPSSQNNSLKELYSSESSDNGSDVEEVLLSDTSTSSDEATYIAPASSFHHYNLPVSYKLHTILEESCEESEKSSRGNTPTSHVSSDFVYYSGDNVQAKDLKFPRSPKKLIPKFKPSSTPSKTFPENPSDSRTKKDAAVNAVLASTRLENYFRSAPVENPLFSFADDDLTDESGGISSDDDRTSDGRVSKWHSKKNVQNSVHSSHRYADSKTVHHTSSNQSSVDTQVKQKKYHCKIQSSRKDLVNPNHVDPPKNKSCRTLSTKSNDTRTTLLSSILHQELRDSHISSETKSTNYSHHKSNNKPSSELNSCKTANIENVSDDEAKFIMNHVIQHITNNNETCCHTEPDTNDVSPAIKILESEITRLMLTVSPVSLSAGEPSSSCSSTIGSNNSDYGSDTLESCEETTSDDEHADVNHPNSPQLPFVPRLESNNSPSLSSHCVPVPSQEEKLPESQVVIETAMTDETLYICKQLVASLKKIADSTEASMVSDELSKAEADDNTAKQYIADQIVSLMQTVNASRNNSPLTGRSFSCHLTSVNLNALNCQDQSDSDSPPPHDEKRGIFKSKTPSESGSETTISASISIPSYDDSDRTPTESEISHEMDELYALLESSSCAQDTHSFKFSYDSDSHVADGGNAGDSPSSDVDDFKPSNSFMYDKFVVGAESSLLFGAASKLESLLPISIEERIARYNDAFLHKENDVKSNDPKDTKMRINVILPQAASPQVCCNMQLNSEVTGSCYTSSLTSEGNSYVPSMENITEGSFDLCSQTSEESGVTSVKIIANNTFYPGVTYDKVSSAEQKVHSLDSLATYMTDSVDMTGSQDLESSTLSLETVQNDEETTSIVSPLPKVINPKEKASSENDLLVANYRAKSKNSKVFGTKSAGNISELENTSKSTFRDTGYYSFKSSDESFLSLDDSTTSRTSTTSLTQYRSLTSTETIPEEEESSCKAASPSKISLSSGNIPFEVCDTQASKSSTLPLSLRGKMSSASGGSHRTRSSFFSTSGVLRKLTLLRDESGNSLHSSPHGRMRIRHRTLSGGSEDGRQKRESLPHISVSDCAQSSPSGTLNAANSERDSLGRQEEDIDQIFAYQSRSQMSLSSYGGRSESVTSVYSAAGGGRYGTVTVTGEVFFSLKYNYKASVFEVLVKECRNLAPVDTKRNRSDPYVKVYLLPDRTKSGKRKTKVKKHTLNPVFDELLKFQVTISELEKRVLWLSVWHSDRFGRNDFLGEVVLELGHDNFENTEIKCYALQERTETFDAPVSYKGDIILALKYVPPDVTSRKPHKKHGTQAKGSVHVLVREARNLMATRSNGTSDPFCKSYLLPDKSKAGKQKTPVFKKTCNPKWNHTFVYDDITLDDLRERCLELTIWDYDKITSNDFLGGVRLCLGTGKHQGRDVDWMDSVGEEVSLWYTMIERPNTWVDGSLLLRQSMQNRRIT